MPKKVTVHGVECEIDDDIDVKDLDQEAEPSNALTADELQQILDDEKTLGE